MDVIATAILSLDGHDSLELMIGLINDGIGTTILQL